MKLPIEDEMRLLEERLYDYEASESVANTGTGSRREGGEFEKLVGDYWLCLKDVLISRGVDLCRVVEGAGKRKWWCLEHGKRRMLLPCHPHEPLTDSTEQPHRWLELVFRTEDILDSFPGRQEARDRYAPARGPYADENYHALHDGLSTKFDDTVLLIEDDILKEKWLLEYKTAKSSKGSHIDGNAHERLSFQIMQYLEVAPRYTRCRFVVIANGAFVKYRNKYHANFHVQADRLSNFGWFNMRHACTPEEYRHLIDELVVWILNSGKPI